MNYSQEQQQDKIITNNNVVVTSVANQSDNGPTIALNVVVAAPIESKPLKKRKIVATTNVDAVDLQETNKRAKIDKLKLQVQVQRERIEALMKEQTHYFEAAKHHDDVAESALDKYVEAIDKTMLLHDRIADESIVDADENLLQLTRATEWQAYSESMINTLNERCRMSRGAFAVALALGPLIDIQKDVLEKQENKLTSLVNQFVEK